MVTARRSEAITTPRKAKESLETKFERLMSEPVGAPIGKLSKREAIYFLRRLKGSDPDGPLAADSVLKNRGDWGERLTTLEKRPR